MVDALTWWPSLRSSPWILLYPQSWFSVASRSMRAAISALTGGRPVRFGEARFRMARRRCHRRTVPGDDQPVHPRLCLQEPDQCGEDRAVGPVQPGPRMSAVKHGDLVPQHEQLHVLGGR